ncbi:hypothetical protein MASR1M90_22970 [Desulfovibrionales bacterium]
MNISIAERIHEYLNDPASDLPVFSQTALIVQEEAARAEPDTKKILECIERDQVLTMEVLKVANAPFYRGIKKVTRIQDAMVRIGLREMINCVMLASQRANYRSTNASLQHYATGLWKHSVACAFGANWLAQKCGYPELGPEAFISGLIHDVGKLLVLKALTSPAEQGHDIPRITKTAAEEFIAALHMEYGAALIERWHLPEVYATICRDHHRDDYEATNILLVLVRMANAVCAKLGIGLFVNSDIVLVTCSEAGVLGLSDITLAELEVAVEDYLVRSEF